LPSKSLSYFNSPQDQAIYASTLSLYHKDMKNSSGSSQKEAIPKKHFLILTLYNPIIDRSLFAWEQKEGTASVFPSL
jgi:hypothetical protein